MGSRKPLTEKEVAHIHRRAAEKVGQRTIAKELGRSLGMVNLVLNSPGAVAPPPTRRAAPVEPEPAPEPLGETDPTAERRDSLKSLRGARKLAEANRDPIRIIQAALGAAKVAGDIERSNPKPPDVAKLPKTREMGAKARQRLHDLLTRMQQQAAETTS
jgi:hypothetical protein